MTSRATAHKSDQSNLLSSNNLITRSSILITTPNETMLSRRLAPRALRSPLRQPLLLPRFAHKDAQDKDSMNVEPNEYSKTGSDSQAAHKQDAFDPNTTRPEEQKGVSSPPNGSYTKQ